MYGLIFLVLHLKQAHTTYGPQATYGPSKDFLWHMGEILF